MAVVHGQDACVRLLLEHGAEVSGHSDYLSYTPLIAAAGHCTAEVVSLLIAHSADVDALGDDDVTPLVNTARHQRTEIVDILLQAGATQ